MEKDIVKAEEFVKEIMGGIEGLLDTHVHLVKYADEKEDERACVALKLHYAMKVMPAILEMAEAMCEQVCLMGIADMKDFKGPLYGKVGGS